MATSLFQLEKSASAAMQYRTQEDSGRKPDLRSLERNTNRKSGRNKLVQSQSYDDGSAIALQTASGAFSLYPEQMAAATSRNSYADALNYDDSFTDAFYVEPFEEPAPASPAPVVTPTDGGVSPEPSPSVVTQPSPAAPAATTPPQYDSAPAPVATPPAVLAPSAPVSAPDSDDDNFEDDIRQILEKAAQQPQKPEPPQPILKKPTTEAPTAEAPEAEQSQQTSAADPHEIFDSMAASMGHATTFDLGVVDLSHRFNEIENQLDVEEQVGQQKALATSFTSAAGLDDADLIDDLSAVSSLLEEKLKEEQSMAPAPITPQPAAPQPGNIATPPDARVPSATEPTPATEAAPAAPQVPPPSSAAPAQPATPTLPNGDGTAATQPVTPSTVPTPPAAMPDAGNIDINYKVPVAQATGAVPAQAAGAAMLVAWRDQTTIDTQALAAGSGSWAAYAPGLKATGPEFFKTWGLKEIAPDMLTLERLHSTLKAQGPLWLQNPAVESAVRIVVGIAGDGSNGGTSITVINPAADAQNVQQTANINSLISQLGNGPVRIAHLTA